MKLFRLSTTFFIFFMFISAFSASNINTPGDEEYLAFAEKMPEPVGGLKAIYSNVSYPDAAKSSGVQGKVYILAFINENGTVDKAKVVMGIGAGCDEEAIKAVEVAKFSPAIHEGKPVKVKYSIPITFEL